jgi:hypothetical protein
MKMPLLFGDALHEELILQGLRLLEAVLYGHPAPVQADGNAEYI